MNEQVRPRRGHPATWALAAFAVGAAVLSGSVAAGHPAAPGAITAPWPAPARAAAERAAPGGTAPAPSAPGLSEPASAAGTADRADSGEQPGTDAQPDAPQDTDGPRTQDQDGPGVVAPGPAYGWPLRPTPSVTAPFREPSTRYGPGHRGVDLAGLPGAPVFAARSGTVVFAGPLAGRGVVSVLHADGLRTTYEPVRATVAVGALVGRGEVIGTLDAGHPGCPAAACLHWGVRRAEADYLDPLVLLGPGSLRLLPAPDRWPW